MALELPDGYDREDQAQRLIDMLIPGETLYGVYDCKGRGSGFVGITDLRILARDDGFKGRDKQTVSIPYNRSHAVGIEADKGAFRTTTTLSISAGDDEWTFEFKGADKLRKAYDRLMKHLLRPGQ